MTRPHHLHLAAIRKIIRCLIGTPHIGLVFPVSSPITLIAYSDSDWAGCPNTCRAQQVGACI